MLMLLGAERLKNAGEGAEAELWSGTEEGTIEEGTMAYRVHCSILGARIAWPKGEY
jgi:hypothetical protein